MPQIQLEETHVKTQELQQDLQQSEPHKAEDIIPKELWGFVFSHLPVKNSITAQSVSKAFLATREDQLLWKARFAKHFPHWVEKIKEAETWFAAFKRISQLEYQQFLPRELYSLIAIVKDNDLENLKTFPFSVDDLFRRDSNDISILEWIYKNGSEEMLEFLYKKFDIDLKPEQKLRHAILFQQTDIIHQLKATGMSFDENNVGAYNNLTPLVLAAQYGSKKSVEALLDCGAQINLASTSCTMDNAPANATPLLMAAKKNNEELVHLLLSRGADPKKVVRLNDTALHFAAKNGNAKLAKVFLDAGADVNAIGDYGCTPLHNVAAHSGNPEVATLLLERGSHLNWPSHSGLTPYGFAIHNERIEIIKIIEADKRHIANIIPIHKATASNKLLSIQYFLDKKDDIEVKNDNGQTAFHIAATQSDLITVQFLLDNGAQVDVLDNDQCSPLHCAANRKKYYDNKSEILEAILTISKKNINLRDKDGCTPLYYAVKSKDVNSVRILLKNGAKVDFDLSTELHAAIHSKT